MVNLCSIALPQQLTDTSPLCDRHSIKLAKIGYQLAINPFIHSMRLTKHWRYHFDTLFYSSSIDDYILKSALFESIDLNTQSNTSLTLTLKHPIFFHDGQRLKTQDIIASVDYFFQQRSEFSNLKQQLSLIAVSEDQIRLESTMPLSKTNLATLTMIPITTSTCIKQPNCLHTMPPGTGSFRLITHKTNHWTVFERSPLTQKNHKLALPFHRMEIFYYRTNKHALEDFKNRSIDFFPLRYQEHWINAQQHQAKLGYHTIENAPPSSMIAGFFMNTHHPWLAKESNRSTLIHLFHSFEWEKRLLGEEKTLASNYFSYSDHVAAQQTQAFKTKPIEKKYLTSLKSLPPLKIIVPNRHIEKIARLFSAQLEDQGIAVKIQRIMASEYPSIFNRGNYDLIFLYQPSCQQKPEVCLSRSSPIDQLMSQSLQNSAYKHSLQPENESTSDSLMSMINKQIHHGYLFIPLWQDITSKTLFWPEKFRHLSPQQWIDFRSTLIT